MPDPTMGPDAGPDQYQEGQLGVSALTPVTVGLITVYALTLLTDNFLPSGSVTGVKVLVSADSPFVVASAQFTLTDSLHSTVNAFGGVRVDGTAGQAQASALSHIVECQVNGGGLYGAFTLSVIIIADDGGGDPQTLVLPLGSAALFFS